MHRTAALLIALIFISETGYSQKSKTVFPADADTLEFVNGSDLSEITLNPTITDNLFILGKVWGLLKYYHPYIGAGNLNWDYELFRFLPNYLSAKNKDERNKLLSEWISKWPKPEICNSCNDDILNKAVHKPTLEWLADENELGKDLSAQLLFIKNNRHQGKNYYMESTPGVGNPMIQHEDAYKQFTYPDAGYRLLALYRYWNMIEYWFPNKKIIGNDWNENLRSFIPKLMDDKNAAEYTLTIQELISSIHDTHANIWGKNPIRDSLKGKYWTPVQYHFVDNQPVINRILHDSLAKASNLQLGDVLESMDGKPVSQMIEEAKPYLAASNEPTELRNFVYSNLMRSQKKSSTVTVFRDGKSISTTIYRLDKFPVKTGGNVNFDYQANKSFFFIAPDIGYINLWLIKKSQLDSVFKALKGSKGLIIDNRLYPGDFVIYELGRHLMPSAVPFVKFPKPVYNYPGAFEVTRIRTVGDKKNKNYYKGKVIILIDEHTQSSGEFHTMAFRQAPNSLVIGSTTAGADGNVSGFYLPGNIYTMFSGIGVWYPDGTETQRIGIVPDIEVKPTIQGSKEGRDELVEKAIELINDNKTDPQKTKKAF